MSTVKGRGWLLSTDTPQLPTKLPAHGVPPSVAHVEEDENGVRRLKFSDERINEALTKQLGDVPAAAPFAVVATAFKDHDGTLQTKFAAYFRKQDVEVFGMNGDLSFGGFIAGDVKHPLDTVGAEVRWIGR